MKRRGAEIRWMFRALEAAMGPQHWWPAGSAFEVVVGAYLAQNTAWTNVERAMGNLRKAGVLTVSGIRNMAAQELEQLIRPAGYFRQKAARLKLFVEHLDARHGGSLEAMFSGPTWKLREELLGLTGIGPETADSILLYAACHEVFVVDTYTRRIFQRHGLAETDADYEEIRLGVETALSDLKEAPENSMVIDRNGQLTPVPLAHLPSAASQMARSELSQRYSEFHALIVQTAKHYCMKGTPKCEACPLKPMLQKPPKL